MGIACYSCPPPNFDLPEIPINELQRKYQRSPNAPIQAPFFLRSNGNDDLYSNSAMILHPSAIFGQKKRSSCLFIDGSQRFDTCCTGPINMSSSTYYVYLDFLVDQPTCLFTVITSSGWLSVGIKRARRPDEFFVEVSFDNMVTPSVCSFNGGMACHLKLGSWHRIFVSRSPRLNIDPLDAPLARYGDQILVELDDHKVNAIFSPTLLLTSQSSPVESRSMSMERTTNASYSSVCSHISENIQTARCLPIGSSNIPHMPNEVILQFSNFYTGDLFVGYVKDLIIFGNRTIENDASAVVATTTASIESFRAGSESEAPTGIRNGRGGEFATQEIVQDLSSTASASESWSADRAAQPVGPGQIQVISQQPLSRSVQPMTLSQFKVPLISGSHMENSTQLMQSSQTAQANQPQQAGSLLSQQLVQHAAEVAASATAVGHASNSLVVPDLPTVMSYEPRYGLIAYFGGERAPPTNSIPHANDAAAGTGLLITVAVTDRRTFSTINFLIDAEATVGELIDVLVASLSDELGCDGMPLPPIDRTKVRLTYFGRFLSEHRASLSAYHVRNYSVVEFEVK